MFISIIVCSFFLGVFLREVWEDIRPGKRTFKTRPQLAIFPRRSGRQELGPKPLKIESPYRKPPEDPPKEAQGLPLALSKEDRKREIIRLTAATLLFVRLYEYRKNFLPVRDWGSVTNAVWTSVLLGPNEPIWDDPSWVKLRHLSPDELHFMIVEAIENARRLNEVRGVSVLDFPLVSEILDLHRREMFYEIYKEMIPVHLRQKAISELRKTNRFKRNV
jgi:hypothetical protein